MSNEGSSKLEVLRRKATLGKRLSHRSTICKLVSKAQHRAFGEVADEASEQRPSKKHKKSASKMLAQDTARSVMDAKKVCNFFAKGTCRRGDACQYRHECGLALANGKTCNKKHTPKEHDQRAHGRTSFAKNDRRNRQ